MGCTASRDGAAFSERDKDRFGSLRRVGKSSSFTHLRSSKPRDLHYDYHVVALTSSTYGLMKLLETETVNEHLVSVIGGKGANTSCHSKIGKPDSTLSDERPSKKWTDMAMGASRFKLEQLRKDQIEAKYPLNPKEPDEAPGPSEAETINTWELMEGLDDQTTPLVTPSTTTVVSTKEIGHDLLNKVSDAPMMKALPRSRSLSAVDGLKLLNKGGIARPDLLAIDSSSSEAQNSTNQSSEHSNRGSTDLSSTGSMDYSLRSSQPLSSAGLPAEFAQQYSGPLNGVGLPLEYAQRYSGPLSNAGAPLSFSQRYSGPLNSSGLPAGFLQRYSGPLSNAGLPTGQVMGFPVQDFQTVFPSVSDVSLGDETTNNNLFDPDILATFQDMIHLEERSSSEDDWYHIRSSDGEASTSSSTDDGDSPVQWASRNQNVFESSAQICDGSRDASHSGTFAPRRISFAKVMPVDPPEIVDPLLQFAKKCPPGGERRVVLYLTSLRGVRKTFEDCHNLKIILQSFPVWVDERDVSMHAEFRQELTDLLGGPVIVPRVFIKGHYIGGPDEVRRLHEDGKLGALLQDLPVVQYRTPCDGCGGVRFVPCPECSGSCKIITDTNDVAQCPDCNENGLIRCPVCF